MKTNVEARQQKRRAVGAAPCLNVRSVRCYAGFTLIELIAVAALIAVMAMVAVTVYDGVGENAQDQLVRAEMQEIKKALQQFKRDVGRYPCMEHPADFTEMILGEPVDVPVHDPLEVGERAECEHASLPAWNPEYSRGWRGPYLSSDGNGYVTIGDNLKLDGSNGTTSNAGSPTAGTPYVDYRPGIADPFAYGPAVVGSDVYLEWLPCAACVGKPYESWGRPYYIFDLHDLKRARIVSAGRNGKYESPPLPDDALDPEDNPICADIFDEDVYGSHGDDVILCLQ